MTNRQAIRNHEDATRRSDAMHARGFDQSEPIEGYAVRIRCSQCAALVINGVPAHESGCPHTVYECKGCNAIVTRRNGYCEDCQ